MYTTKKGVFTLSLYHQHGKEHEEAILQNFVLLSRWATKKKNNKIDTTHDYEFGRQSEVISMPWVRVSRHCGQQEFFFEFRKWSTRMVLYEPQIQYLEHDLVQ